MAKAALQLTEDPATGKIMVPAGVTLADLMAAWRQQYALVDRLIDENDAKGGASITEAEHFRQEQDYCHAIEQALWERPAECLDDLRMLAELALTYEGSTDELAATFGKAVLSILGPIDAKVTPAALFAPVQSPRIGLTVGR